MDRRTLVLRGASLALGAPLLALAPAARAGAPAGTLPLLVQALRVEDVQLDLHRAGARADGLSPALRELARDAAADERVHATVLRERLGAWAPGPPAVRTMPLLVDDSEYLRAALAIEELAVRAHVGRVALLDPRDRALVAGIAAVDARHAAWLRSLRGPVGARHVHDTPLAPGDVAAALAATGLVDP